MNPKDKNKLRNDLLNYLNDLNIPHTFLKKQNLKIKENINEEYNNNIIAEWWDIFNTNNEYIISIKWKGRKDTKEEKIVNEESVANDILIASNMIAYASDKITNNLYEKLKPIMTQYQLNQNDAIECPTKEYPPLFAKLYENLKTIENNLDIIEDIIRKIEL
jgi:hypothetical protein